MTTLTIRRLGAETTHPDLTRVQQLLRRVADRALEERQATYEALSGEWCVRRLDLELALPPDEPDSTTADRWAALIAGAIRDLVPDGKNVLHFRSRSRLLLDLVVGIAAGDLSRAWAWRQAGLLAVADPDPAEQPVAALLAALGREPRLAVPVLVGAVEQAGIRAVHALLGPLGWAGLADLVRPGWRAAGSPAPGAVDPTAERRAGAVLAASRLAPLVGSVQPPPDQQTRTAWAVLVLAEMDPGADPGLLPWICAGLAPKSVASTAVLLEEPGVVPAPVNGGGRPDQPRAGASATAADSGAAGLTRLAGISRGPADGVADQFEGLVAGASTRSARTPVTPGAVDLVPEQPEGPVAGTSAGSERRSPGGLRGAPEPVEGAVEDAAPPSADLSAEPGVPTCWAGLLFVLNAATAAGLPDAIDSDLRLAGRPLRWVLHQLALRLVPVAAADPAALALAGLTPAMAIPAGPPAESLEERALDQHAAEWAAAVGRLLDQARHPEDDSPRLTLWSLARRPGRIVADPGWIEVQLPLDEIDLTVRRAGLDLDPGWLGWLGTVLVFRYV